MALRRPALRPPRRGRFRGPVGWPVGRPADRRCLGTGMGTPHGRARKGRFLSCNVPRMCDLSSKITWFLDRVVVADLLDGRPGTPESTGLGAAARWNQDGSRTAQALGHAPQSKPRRVTLASSNHLLGHSYAAKGLPFWACHWCRHQCRQCSCPVGAAAHFETIRRHKQSAVVDPNDRQVPMLACSILPRAAVIRPFWGQGPDGGS